MRILNSRGKSKIRIDLYYHIKSSENKSNSAQLNQKKFALKISRNLAKLVFVKCSLSAAV